MQFDMNRTWNQAIALVRSNFQLLAIIAGVFLLLPATLLYVAMPDFMTTLQMAGDDPDQIEAMLAAMAGPLIVYGVIAFLFQMVGYMAMIALMGNDRPTVGEALRRALSGLVPVVLATIVLTIVYLVLAFVLALALGLIIAAISAIAGEGASTALAFLLVLAMFVAILFVATRFTLLVPAIILEQERNPIAALKRSWALTKGSARKIFLFYLLLVICYMVLSLILGGLFGLVALAFGGGTGSALLLGLANGLIGSAVAMIFSGVLVSMHMQLAGTDSATIRETFQ